jgi:hypothetical protein
MDTRIRQRRAVGCGRGLSPRASHESTSLGRLLRQEGLAPQMSVGHVNCDATGTQRGHHPAGEKEDIPRDLPLRPPSETPLWVPVAMHTMQGLFGRSLLRVVLWPTLVEPG